MDIRDNKVKRNYYLSLSKPTGTARRTIDIFHAFSPLFYTTILFTPFEPRRTSNAIGSSEKSYRTEAGVHLLAREAAPECDLL